MTADLARTMPSVAVMVAAFSARSWARLGDAQAARRALDRADETRRFGPESAWLDEVLEAAHREVTARSPLGALTPAELRVWHQLATTTRTIREISETLYLSVDTVKSHLSSIYRKLGVSSRREALALIESDSRQRG